MTSEEQIIEHIRKRRPRPMLQLVYIIAAIIATGLFLKQMDAATDGIDYSQLGPNAKFLIEAFLWGLLALTTLMVAVNLMPVFFVSRYEHLALRLYDRVKDLERRIEKNNEPNHGLESTSAPPAAGTLETHP